MLERHARYVRDDADALAQVNTAAGSMSLTDGAFGVMCANLVLPAMGVTFAAQSLMQEAKDMLNRESATLKTAAVEFAEVDEDYAHGFNQAETGDSISGEY